MEELKAIQRAAIVKAYERKVETAFALFTLNRKDHIKDSAGMIRRDLADLMGALTEAMGAVDEAAQT